jgi:Domain of unknown function (DUF4190)
MGVASMVLGICAAIPCFWWFQIPGVLAIIFGGIALSQIKHSPRTYTGRGPAVAGLLLGILSIVGLSLLLALSDFTTY